MSYVLTAMYTGVAQRCIYLLLLLPVCWPPFAPLRAEDSSVSSVPSSSWLRDEERGQTPPRCAEIEQRNEQNKIIVQSQRVVGK